MIEKNWKEIIKPSKLDVREESKSENTSTIIAEPLERGYGVTIGNALRRILLSSLQGSAITSIQVQGVLHEFSSIPGVREDLTDIILNVKGIKVKNVKTNKINEIKLDGVFIAIGHDPATQLFKDQLNMDKEGYLITKPDSTETNIPGVYAAGDVKDKTFRQAVTAAGMGCMAALEAEKFLSH